jgi:SAM-dependent methyltransferase
MFRILADWWRGGVLETDPAAPLPDERPLYLSATTAAARIPVSYPVDGHPLSDEEARQFVLSAKWYHRWEIRPGLITPGECEFRPGPVCDLLGLPADLSGLRILDIGSGDGPLAFEMERRGAEVVALDVQDPHSMGFAVARRILDSQVVHIQASVYELPKLGLAPFDLVVFKSVYYQLRHPLLALEAIARVLKLGGRLHFEGEGALNHIEDLDGKPAPVDLKALLAARVPVCFIYPYQFKQGGNRFIPSPACLEGWLTVCGFRVQSMGTWESSDPPFGGQRLYGVAEKVAEPSDSESPLY